MDHPTEARLTRFLRGAILSLGISTLAISSNAQQVEDPDEEAPPDTVAGEVEEPEAENAEDAATPARMEELVVVGSKLSLDTARAIKRDADNIVDSVTAVDVGSLPDKSVAEALQRLPGITVTRFASSTDTQHFSAEPSGVIIRGLDYVRTEFNGRDTFSADSSRGLSMEDVTPELMSRIDVYKNQSADLIEGGIAGVVDLHTRVPFDFDGESMAASADLNYSAVSDSFDPNVSGLYSNRWTTNLGEFGVLGQLAASTLDTRSEGIYLGRMGIHEAGYFEEETPNGVQPTSEETYAPTFVTARDNLYERERTGGAFAAQWESPDEDLLATFQYNRSEYEQVNTEYSALNFLFALWGQPADHVIPSGWADGMRSLPGETFEFSDRRSFESGEPTAGPGWWGSTVQEAAAFGVNEEGIPLVNPNGCGTDNVSAEYTEKYCEKPYDQRAVGMETNSRQIHSSDMTQDASFNLKWSPTNEFRMNFDFQYVDATSESYGTAGALQSYTGMYVDFGGDLPYVEYRDPLNVNFSEGGLQNPNSWNYAWLQDFKSDSQGESLAGKIDAEYDLNTRWLESVRFGIRSVKREQLVQEAASFRGITSRWWQGVAPYWNADRTEPIDSLTTREEETFFAGYPNPDNVLTRRSFPDSYMGGGVMDSTELLYIDPDFLGNPSAVNASFAQENLGIGEFNPICSATGARGSEITDDNGNSTCFTPGETLNVEETANAAYVRLDFGGPDLTLPKTDVAVSGNVGVRYVETDTLSEGSISYGTFTADQLNCYKREQQSTDDSVAPPSTEYSAGCYLIGAEAHNKQVPDMPDKVDDGNGNMIDNPSKVYLPEHITGSRDDLDYHDGTIASVVGDQTHYNLLPSLNVKFDITDQLVARLALSKSMARPDFSLYRYAAQINEPGIDVSYAAQCKNYNQETGVVEDLENCEPNEELTFDDQGRLTGARPRYSVSTGNPYLEPITANNYDMTLEYYFETDGMLTLNLFRKDFQNYVTYGTTVVPTTNKGVTRDMYINGPVNGDGAGVKGFEVNFQKFMDFLPEPWDGIGVQANYTKIYNDGIQNTNYDSGTGGAVEDDAERYVKVDALQGMSEDAYNLILMYEKGPFAFRTAYNWRSEYLVTANDCCNLPVWQSEQGFLDATVRLRLTDMIEMSLQATNLLDTTTNLYQQVRGSDHEEYPNHKVPTAWFKSDQRYSLGIRMKY